VKDPKRFTFKADDLGNRIPSARQLVYADRRANPHGRLPDDTWVLRPQDLADCFTAAEDTWYFPRVAGTFKERAGFHGCQMPEQLLGRIIRLCSHTGELVFDPFSGSATTLAVAKKLDRRFLGVELSPEYVTRGNVRLAEICAGDSLEGSPEPTVSAPRTPTGPAKNNGRKYTRTETSDVPAKQNTTDLLAGLLDAYRHAYDGYSLDRVVADPDLNAKLRDACVSRGIPGEPRTWNSLLFRLRKQGLLVQFPASRRTEYRWEDCEPYQFASEIAWRQIADSGCQSLDTILCDPELASQFDRIARRWAPGYSSIEYRWAALQLRKKARDVRERAQSLPATRLKPAVRFDSSNVADLPNEPGVYMVLSSSKTPLYAGAATNIRERIVKQFGDSTRELWSEFAESLAAKYLPISCRYTTRIAHQRRLIDRHEPLLNLPDTRLHEGLAALSI
jgi:site-specific DNA-methyltransferase (adenine-specific)